jgi:hypothetical protein
LRESLSDAILPLDNIASAIQAEQQLLTDLPTAWPLAAGRAVVTMEFGPNIHPVHGNWYLHKGIDIAGPTGLPVQAAANGKVVEAGFNGISGYGNYVLIEHKYGFRTRYSHMSQILVRAGQTVAQGERDRPPGKYRSLHRSPPGLPDHAGNRSSGSRELSDHQKHLHPLAQSHASVIPS